MRSRYLVIALALVVAIGVVLGWAAYARRAAKQRAIAGYVNAVLPDVARLDRTWSRLIEKLGPHGGITPSDTAEAAREATILRNQVQGLEPPREAEDAQAAARDSEVEVLLWKASIDANTDAAAARVNAFLQGLPSPEPNTYGTDVETHRERATDALARAMRLLRNLCPRCAS